MHSLTNGDVVIEGTKDLLAHATSFYNEMFGPAPGNPFQLSPETWADHEMLNDEDNAFLTKPFSEEEIKEVLFSMDSNRAPGLDHFPAEFYQVW